ncbi:MAG: hypothetical protein ACRDZO_01295 [Egibacteraceae bacterium]
MTGAAERVDEVAKVFEQVGYHVTRATNHERLSEICASLGPKSIDCYVQLPGRIEARGDTVVARVRNFLSDGLIRRFDAVAEILPALRPGGSVLLVAGNHPADSTGPDDQRARLSLLSVLAHALVTERGGTGVTVTILDHQRTPQELAEIAQSPGDRPVRLIARLAEIEPELDYDDWRNEVLALTTTDT